MTLSTVMQDKVNQMIFARAFEIEQILSADDFLHAKIAGVHEDNVSDVALECAIRELKKEFES